MKRKREKVRRLRFRPTIRDEYRAEGTAGISYRERRLLTGSSSLLLELLEYQSVIRRSYTQINELQKMWKKLLKNIS